MNTIIVHHIYLLTFVKNINKIGNGRSLTLLLHGQPLKEAPYSWFSLKHFLYRSEASRDSRVES